MEDFSDRADSEERGAVGPAVPEAQAAAERVSESEEIYRSDTDEEPVATGPVRELEEIYRSDTDEEQLFGDEAPEAGAVGGVSEANPADDLHADGTRVVHHHYRREVHHYHHQHCKTVSCEEAVQGTGSAFAAGASEGTAQRHEQWANLRRDVNSLRDQQDRTLVAVEECTAELRRLQLGRRERARQRVSAWEPIEVVRDLGRTERRGGRSPTSERRSPSRRSPLVARRSPSPGGRSNPRACRGISPPTRDQGSHRLAGLFSQDGLPSGFSAWVATARDRDTPEVRRNTRNFFLNQVLFIRALHPDWDSERAWYNLVRRVLATGFYTTGGQVERAWLIAFAHPPLAHFRSVWERDFTQLRIPVPPAGGYAREDLIRF